MATNFDIAPPAKTVDGLLAVPIDISSIDAEMTFDGATSAATADATITYTVGPTAGNPIFDLRQSVTEAWLDGAAFPPAQLGHHSFGTGPFTDLRVIESAQDAGSVHALRVRYDLALPDSEMVSGYLPRLDWAAGPRLRLVFGLSDLKRCRYAEAWLPANLIFDQFSIDLGIRILNTPVAHSVITNGVATSAGTNQWHISFPSRFTAVSPLLEVRATDTLEQSTGSVHLPVSGRTVTIEAWKPAGAPTDLQAQIDLVGDHLTANENNYGPYLHANRFVAFFNGGGMEYEGGTTTAPGALLHETFHSWYARGIKPASQADGWWDEGFTSFHDSGADDPIPFDFAMPPVVLCSRDPWQRHTPLNAYGDGSAFFAGLASMLGVSTLNTLMGDLYGAQRGSTPVTTARMEEFLVSRSGNAQVVSGFHRFAFGLADPGTPPDLWLRDAPGDPGADLWGDAFWDSPDVWIRNADDGGTTHQSPESGQDNWFHARVRNKAGSDATHFVVTFKARGFAGTEFVFPGDFLPADAAKAEFDLEAGGTRVVKARWPRHLVPAAGAHTCVLAAVLSRSDMPGGGRHVWEDNNLAQKNLTVVDVVPDSWLVIPVVISNWSGWRDGRFDLEVDPQWRKGPLRVSLVHRSRAVLGRAGEPVHRFMAEPDGRRRPPADDELDCGGPLVPGRVSGTLLTSESPELVSRRFSDSWELPLPEDRELRLPIKVPPFTQTVVGLKVAVPAGAEPGQSTKVHLVQRRHGAKEAVGGVAVQVRVAERRRPA